MQVQGQPPPQGEEEGSSWRDHEGAGFAHEAQRGERHQMCKYLQQQAKLPTAAAPAVVMTAAGGKEAADGVGSGSSWSAEEESALQAALHEFAPSMPKAERWRRIAMRVPSKTIRECWDKVRELRAALKNEIQRQLKAGAEASCGGGRAKGSGGLDKVKTSLLKFTLDSGEGGEGAAAEQQSAAARARGLDASDDADSDEPQDDEEEEGEEEEEEEEESEGEGEEGEKSHIRPLGSDLGADGRVSLTGHHRGTQIKLNDLLLQGVSVVQLAQARVQCVCNRCSLKLDVVLARGKELEEDCPRCRMARTVRLRSDVLHANNVSAGYVDTEGCAVLDLLPSDYWLACEACGAETCHRRLQRGTRSHEVCRGCFAKLSVGFGKARGPPASRPDARCCMRDAGCSHASFLVDQWLH